jgi:PAS domain S-box-containing protein
MSKLMNRNHEQYFPKVISELKGFAIFMMNKEGIILSWNLGCEMIKGFTSEEAIGKNYEILFPDFLREVNLPQKETEYARIHGRYELENWRRHKSGDIFWAHVVLTKIVDDDGEFIGFVKITQDYSQRKNYEDELKKQKENLQKVNEELKKAKDDLIASNAEILIQKNEELTRINQDLDLFVYTASHDLRNPISNLEGLLQLITEQASYNNKELKPLFEMMNTSIEKLKKIIQELTEISKIQNSEADEDQFNALNELIEEVRFSLKVLISRNKAKIDVDIKSCSDIKFSAKNLRSILYNLVSNSIKYASFERDPEILIKTTREDKFCVLIIKDNGLGISKENQEKMFNKYKRFHDHVEGTGLGLYMIKRIVDNAGGKIEVESEEGIGSTFKIYFKA